MDGLKERFPFTVDFRPRQMKNGPPYIVISPVLGCIEGYRGYTHFIRSSLGSICSSCLADITQDSPPV